MNRKFGNIGKFVSPNEAFSDGIKAFDYGFSEEDNPHHKQELIDAWNRGYAYAKNNTSEIQILKGA